MAFEHSNRSRRATGLTVRGGAVARPAGRQAPTTNAQLRAESARRRGAHRARLIRELELEAENLRQAAGELRQQRDKLLAGWRDDREKLKQQLLTAARKQAREELSQERQRMQEQMVLEHRRRQEEFRLQEQELQRQRAQFEEVQRAETEKIERERRLIEESRALARMEIEATERRRNEEWERRRREHQLLLEQQRPEHESGRPQPPGDPESGAAEFGAPVVSRAEVRGRSGRSEAANFQGPVSEAVVDAVAHEGERAIPLRQLRQQTHDSEPQPPHSHPRADNALATARRRLSELRAGTRKSKGRNGGINSRGASPTDR